MKEYRKMITGSGMTVSEIEDLIEERIFSERDRFILKRLLLDGISYEQSLLCLAIVVLYITEMAQGFSDSQTNSFDRT